MENFPAFFETNEYFINQKVNFFKFEAEYKVFNQEGTQIGFIRQRISAGHKAMRLLLNKAMLPFLLEIVDMEGNLLAVIKRGWTFWMSEIYVLTGNHELIGKIKQKWSFMKPTFHIMDGKGGNIAQIKGDWKGWNFVITDPSGGQIGTVGKKWAGAMKEAFTSADNYNVSIKEEYNEDVDKIVVVSTAITIDMVLKESK
ncbi:MAG: LURP-one-related/scramblase family protein [Dysgonomonas sp.]